MIDTVLNATQLESPHCSKDALTDFFGWMLQGLLAGLAFTCLIGRGGYYHIWMCLMCLLNAYTQLHHVECAAINIEIVTRLSTQSTKFKRTFFL